jgi:hypothetical protein
MVDTAVLMVIVNRTVGEARTRAGVANCGCPGAISVASVPADLSRPVDIRFLRNRAKFEGARRRLDSYETKPISPADEARPVPPKRSQSYSPRWDAWFYETKPISLAGGGRPFQPVFAGGRPDLAKDLTAGRSHPVNENWRNGAHPMNADKAWFWRSLGRSQFGPGRAATSILAKRSQNLAPDVSEGSWRGIHSAGKDPLTRQAHVIPRVLVVQTKKEAICRRVGGKLETTLLPKSIITCVSPGNKSSAGT